jgi:MFS family permease
MLRNRNFLFLLFVSIASTAAFELFSVTVLVTIFDQTNSTLQAAGTMVARTFAAFLLSPVAGVFVDRYPRKNVLISMNLVRIALVGIAIWLSQGEGSVPVASIYLILAGLSAADVFFRPARLSLVPSLVAREELVKANSLLFVSMQVPRCGRLLWLWRFYLRSRFSPQCSWLSPSAKKKRRAFR